MWGNQVWEDLFTFHSDILWNTLHPTRIPKFSVLSTFPHPYMNLMDFPAVFAGLPVEFCTFSQDGFIYCLPSNARQILRLGASDTEAAELWGPDFGEETWKWTVAVIGPEGAIWGIPGVLGSIMIQMMDDQRWMFFFVCWGGVDGEDGGWGWWGWRFPMPFR